MDVKIKREREKQLVSQMIKLYCRKNHNTTEHLCLECEVLNAYATNRSDKCPFMEQKTFCSNCKVNCYKPDMRESIKRIMRFSAPRMLFIHPVIVIRHTLEALKEKQRLKNRK